MILDPKWVQIDRLEAIIHEKCTEFRSGLDGTGPGAPNQQNRPNKIDFTTARSQKKI